MRRAKTPRSSLEETPQEGLPVPLEVMRLQPDVLLLPDSSGHPSVLQGGKSKTWWRERASVGRSHWPPLGPPSKCALPPPRGPAPGQKEPLVSVGAPGWAFTKVGLLSLSKREGGQVRISVV